MKWIVILNFIFTSSLYAYWEKDLTIIKSTQFILVDKSGHKNSVYQINSNQKLPFSIKNRTAIKLKLKADSAGTLEIFNSLNNVSVPLLTQVLKVGVNDIRIFCEPDTYHLLFSTRGQIQIYRWQPSHMLEWVPEGGGIAVPLISKDSSITLNYEFSKGNPIILKAKGPATAVVYIRPYAALTENNPRLEFEIREKEKIITHGIVEPVPSTSVAFINPKIGYAPGKPIKIKLEVPRGLHQYSIESITTPAILKMVLKPKSISLRKRKAANATVKNQVPKNEAPKNEAPLVRVSDSLLSTPSTSAPFTTALSTSLPFTEDPIFMIVKASTGAFYENNVYHYGSQNKMEFSSTPIRPPKFAGVESLGDVYIPLDLELSLQKKSLRLKAQMNTENYWNNPQLNDINFAVTLGWIQPAESGSKKNRMETDMGYLYNPSHTIRPSLPQGSLDYSLLNYAYHRGELKFGLRNSWNPKFQIYFGYFDYETVFNYCDALFLENNLSVGKKYVVENGNKIGWNLSLGVGQVLATKSIDYNWSNTYFSFSEKINFERNNITYGLKAKILERFFSAASNLDAHKNRIDLEYALSPRIVCHYRSLTFTASILELEGRKTFSPQIDDELAKSYLSVGGGLMISSQFKTSNWFGGTKG